MKTPNDYNVDTVYSYETPKDLERFYNDWAHEYDDYTKDVNYILPDQVAKIFFNTISGDNYIEEKKDKILDIGCGTGLLGESFSSINENLWIEGVDISSSMIRIASLKRKKNFAPIDDWVITDDLTNPKLLLTNYYDYFISSGTFTLGHLGSDDFVNLLSYLKSEGVAVISIKEDHFIKDNFEQMFLKLQNDKTIKDIVYYKVNSYDSDFKATSIIVSFKKI
jgi:2-polyprenyl-3-methyl-5-hydroxy-6-metoxy-1,4-benzoquinol methylase